VEIVVTGAGGFSGSHIVGTLLARGHMVTAVVGRSRGRLDAALDCNPALTVVSGDLAGTLPLPTRTEAIVHAAARSPAPGVRDAEMMRDNVTATARLIRYAREAGATTFIFLSSLSIYGNIVGPVVDETTSIVNPNVYGVTKYAGERMLRETPFRSLSIRLPGVLGRASVRNWLTGVLHAAKHGDTIALYNPENKFNNAIHINDLCGFAADIIENTRWSGHDAVTVSAAGMTTVRRAVETIIHTLRSQSPIEIKDAPVPGFTISIERARTLYGYAPMDIESTIRQFARENRD
jgi:nucleoside-diphosphate-sugar epimerase